MSITNIIYQIYSTHNFKDGEDDIDDAPVILTVALGDTVLYIGVAALAVVVLTAGIFIIKKYAI